MKHALLDCGGQRRDRIADGIGNAIGVGKGSVFLEAVSQMPQQD
jgi:RIO-like serine/threonine protein kinase